MKRVFLLIVLLSIVSTTHAQGKFKKDEYQAPVLASTEDISKELSNPNTPLASLTFKTSYTAFEGDLTGADDQDSLTTLFQPVFPFPIDHATKTNLFIRPAIPIVWKTPTLGSNGFRDVNGIGDIGFDIALGRTYQNGTVLVGGMQGLIPLKNHLSVNQWRFGPEFLYAYLSKKWYAAIFPSHLWDTSGNEQYSNTQIEIFAGLYFENAWTLITNPKLSYNWVTDQTTIPLNLTVRKVTKLGSTPLKLELGFDYYVEKDDAFGQDWAINLSITPVIDNFIYNLFK
ncbi:MULTISPECIES: hypothetical protein [unclassified Halobacteriovorax]|uniref:hypothetical protein n=1 Tax=unclassified Halobacteriovorax TaxID=2639665 RepID=UPI00399A85E9